MATTFEQIRTILRECLQLGAHACDLAPDTRLLGSVPELDSMAAVIILTAIEERFGITVEDDDITAETFATVGSLCDYVNKKREVFEN